MGEIERGEIELSTNAIPVADTKVFKDLFSSEFCVRVSRI